MQYQDRLDPGALEKYASALNARAKHLGAKERLNAEQLRDRILGSGGSCEWCGVNLLDADFELDHVVSLAKGGGNSPDNLAVACNDCNRRKADKHPARFAAEIIKTSGAVTPLVAGILNSFQMKAHRQMDLFESGTESSEAAILVDEEARSMPPYNWVD